MLSGILGGMGGCAVIGQTMINVKASGARTRISTFCAGVLLFLLVIGFGDFVGTIPMAALVAVMIMVAIGALDWHSVRPSTLKRMPKSETFVMVATVALVLVTHNQSPPEDTVRDTHSNRATRCTNSTDATSTPPTTPTARHTVEATSSLTHVAAGFLGHA
ncbi:Bicarbonate transporter BicA [Microbacterium sp. SA39]|nr:Bicarbonate transporter BicA [Microbacterium sp. SA39]